ncbi:MAG: hypothetical protein LBI15_04740 [Dysgonamonadaceae bacterium]|jgi:hypothetical protein|nr:hypothetical protein [Dysgonamonadaceae bacterium]
MKTKLFLFSLFVIALLFTSCDFGKERRLRNIADPQPYPISVVSNETKAESETVNKESEPTKTEFKRIVFEYTKPIKGFRVVETWETPTERKCKHCGIAQEEKIWSGDGTLTLTFTSIATGRTFEFVDCGMARFLYDADFTDGQKIYISDIQIPEINRNELVRLSDFFIRTEQGTSAWGFIDLNGDGQYTLFTAFNNRGNWGNSTVRFFSLTTGRELTATTMYENDFLGGSVAGLSVDLKNRRFIDWGIVASTSGNSRVYSYNLNHNQNRLTVKLLKELRDIGRWGRWESDTREAAQHTFFRDSSVETQRPIPDDFWWNREKEHSNGYFDGWQFRRVSVVSQIRDTLTRSEWETFEYFFNLENVYKGL